MNPSASPALYVVVAMIIAELGIDLQVAENLLSCEIYASYYCFHVYSLITFLKCQVTLVGFLIVSSTDLWMQCKGQSYSNYLDDCGRTSDILCLVFQS
jgi:hypothetical protein